MGALKGSLMSFIDDLRSYHAKVTVTRRKWETFLNTVEHPDKYFNHTKTLNDTYVAVSRCCELIKGGHDSIKFSKNIDFDNVYKHWELLEEGLNKVMAIHQN